LTVKNDCGFNISDLIAFTRATCKCADRRQCYGNSCSAKNIMLHVLEELIILSAIQLI